MNSTLITSVLLGGLLFASAPELVHAGQRTRSPGGDSGGSSGSSGGSSGNTGSVAVPRDGGSSPWGGGSTSSSRPSEPTSSSSGGRRTARVPGGGGSGSQAVPAYSRPRNDAPVTGYGVPRGSIATLPPIISGPIYWGPDDWYFYPWGYGGLALGYFWDPWMWSGYGGGGGYPWVDPYWGGGGGGGGGSYGAWDSSGAGANDKHDATLPNPLDPNLPTGGVRLKVEPRDAEVFVDGYYAGIVDDFDGAKQKLKITRGVHVIELRAAGYETTTFNVTIVPGETTTYKTELKRR